MTKPKFSEIFCFLPVKCVSYVPCGRKQQTWEKYLFLFAFSNIISLRSWNICEQHPFLKLNFDVGDLSFKTAFITRGVGLGRVT